MVCYVEEPTLSGIVAASMFSSTEVQSTALGAGRQLREPRFQGYRSPSCSARHREPPGVPECRMTESDGIIEELSTLVFN